MLGQRIAALPMAGLKDCVTDGGQRVKAFAQNPASVGALAGANAEDRDK